MTGGEANHILSIGEMPSHKHDVSAQSTSTTTVSSNAKSVGNSNVYVRTAFSNEVQKTYVPTTADNSSFTATTTTTTTITESSKGSGLAHNNMPPYKVVYIWERVS